MIDFVIKNKKFQFPKSLKNISYDNFLKRFKHANFAPAGKDEVWRELTGNTSLVEKPSKIEKKKTKEVGE